MPPIAVKLKGETAATKPCGWERKETGGSTVTPLTVASHRTLGKKRELQKQGHSPSPFPHLQPPVDHAVGADVHADGLAVLQLQGVLGIESEEVYQLCSSIDFRLDDCFTLPGEVASNKSTEGEGVGRNAAAVSRSGAAQQIRMQSVGCLSHADHVLASERCGFLQVPILQHLLRTKQRQMWPVPCAGRHHIHPCSPPTL